MYIYSVHRTVYSVWRVAVKKIDINIINVLAFLWPVKEEWRIAIQSSTSGFTSYFARINSDFAMKSHHYSILLLSYPVNKINK